MSDTPAGAPATAPSGLKIPMSAEEAGEWQARLDASVKAADAKKKHWEPFVSAYMVKAGKAAPGDHAVVSPLIYAYVELKKSQLRFQVPEVNLKPKQPLYAGAVRAHEGALNHEIKEAGADAMLDMVSTDVLICGIGAVKVGYYADIRTRQVPRMGPPTDVNGQPMLLDPMTQQPTQPVQQLDPVTRAPIFDDEQYVAHECYYGDRLATENVLFPADFAGGDYDRAAYLGHRFQEPLHSAITTYGLPKDFSPTATRPIDTLSSGEQGEGRDSLTTKDVEGIEVFYLASVFHKAADPNDPQAQPVEPPHVGQYRRLVFIKGKTEPVVHEDCPYQYVDEADGKLKGMRGNPLHILTLRYLPGSAYPVSDVEAGFPSSEEVNIGRSQMVNFRDRVMPLTVVDRTKASVELKAQLEAGASSKIGKIIGVDGAPNEVIQAVSVAQFPRDNFKFNEVAQDDFRLAWSMGKHAAGMTEDGEPITATEVQAAQSATDTRLAYEQGQFLKWFCKYAEKFGSLLQQFKDEPGYAEIVGDDDVKALRAWNRQTIDGEFVYTARPDAALRLDINADRQRKLQRYTQLGNDPNVNRVELLRDIFISDSQDPERFVVKELPEKGPEPPRVSYSFKGEDFSPIDLKSGQPNAAFPITVAIAMQLGVKLDETTIQNAVLMGQKAMAGLTMLPQVQPPGQPQTEHPGATTPMQPISKHAADRTAAGGTNLVQ